MDTHSLDSRFRQLHRRCRMLQLWCIILTGSLAIACLAASTSPEPRVLRAQKFELIDEQGNIWGWMKADGGEASILLIDQQDEDSLRLVALGTGRTGAPSIRGEEGHQLTFGVTSDPVYATLAVGGVNRENWDYGTLVASPDSTGFICTGSLSDARAFLGVRKNHEGKTEGTLHLAGEGEDYRVGLINAVASGYAGARIEISDENHLNRRALLAADQDSVRMELSAHPSEGPGVQIEDSTSSGPSLRLKGPDGHEVFRAPGP